MQSPTSHSWPHSSPPRRQAPISLEVEEVDGDEAIGASQPYPSFCGSWTDLVLLYFVVRSGSSSSGSSSNTEIIMPERSPAQSAAPTTSPSHPQLAEHLPVQDHHLVETPLAKIDTHMRGDAQKVVVPHRRETFGRSGNEPLFIHPERFRPNSYFVGREDEIRGLHEMLMDRRRRSEGTSAVLIQCLPGGGKTHLARQYVFQHRDEYPGAV